jgi:cytochrome b561
MHTKLLVPILIASVVLWRIYMRMRRSFGRQSVQPRRMTIRITVLALIGVLLLLAATLDLWTLGGALAGGACGALLALLGLRHTQFESTPAGHFYTPHTYIGLTVTALFLVRLAYDIALLSHGMPTAAPASSNPFAAEQNNPLTLALSAAFIGYYLAYYTGVLRKSRQPGGEAPVIESTPR